MVSQQESRRRAWSNYLLSILLAVPVTLLLWALRDALTLANFSLIYILLILVIAVGLGLGPALLAAVASFFGFNFFLIRPYYTLTVEDPRELLDLFIFLLVAAIASQVAAYARRQAATARLRAAEQQVLYDLSSAFNQFTEAADIFVELKRVVQGALGAREVVWLPEIDQSSADMTTDRSTTSYLLLATGKKVYGTLQVTFAEPTTESQSRLLMASAVQAAMALERIELTGRAQRSRTLEEADRLKTALLHAVSHDLRTPITIIKSSTGNLRNLDERLSPEERLEMVSVIEDEIDLLDRLVGDLLDMSRLQAGALVLHRDWNALVEIAGDVAARAWQIYEKERVKLQFPDEMPLVYCDYGLLLRAVSNITENALRYEPPDSRVEIRGALARDQEGRDEAQIVIVNHGPTIPDEAKRVIMEPFYQGQEAPAAGAGRRDGHVGLGLAIARGIVEAHEGRVWVEDTPGGGATFVIALPLAGDTFSIVEQEQQGDPDSNR